MSVAVLSGVTIDGAPVQDLYPGWSAISRHDVAGGLDVVLLREKSGREACWWVDRETGAYAGSHVLALAEPVRDRFLTALDPVFLPLADGVLTRAPMASQAWLPQDIPRTALLEMAGSWISRHVPHTLILPTGHADSGEGLTCPDGRVIAQGRIRALMGVKRRGETLVLASPFSEIPLRAQLVMSEGTLTGYRFQDPTDDIVFYMIWDEAKPDLRPSFYYPSGTLLISDDPQAAFIPAHLLAWYATHTDHAETLRTARPFLPHDFGVGQASSLRRRDVAEQDMDAGQQDPAVPSTETTRGVEPETLHTSSARPSFLPDIPDTPLAPQKNSGMLARLKRLFGNKT